MIGWIIAGAAIALTSYTAVAAIAAHRMTTAQRRQPQRTPDALGLEFETIQFPARRETLMIAGWYLPAPGARRAVIIAHGIGGCRGREFTINSLPLVQQLIAHGLSVLMLDLRGHGASGAARMTYGARERRDVLGAVDWLRRRGFAPRAIGVLGASMGGVAGIGAAAEEPAIGALVIDSSCADFGTMMRSHFRAFTRLPRIFLPGTLAIARLLTGEDLAELRPARTLRGIAGRPMLVIHATGDRIVPTSHAHANAAAAGADLWITDSPRHLGSYAKQPERYAEQICGFFSQTLADDPHQVAEQQRAPLLMTWSASATASAEPENGAGPLGVTWAAAHSVTADCAADVLTSLGDVTDLDPATPFAPEVEQIA